MKTDMMKRGTKRVFALILCICLAAAMLPDSAAAARYDDIQGHWAQPAIERWSDSGILTGYSDGRFHPNDPVSRGQLATVLYRIWGVDPISGFSYPDLPASSWCYDSLTTMNMHGVALNTDDRICPEAPLTREEAFFMIAKAFQVGQDSDQRFKPYKKYVSDFQDVSDFFTGRIDAMLANGYVRGTSGGALRPKQGITRAEVMTVINNMIDLYISRPGVYHLTSGQTVLITCSNVTVILDDVAQTPQNQDTKAYLMAGAEQGVTFSNPDSSGVKAPVQVLSVTQNEPTWQTEGNFSLSAKKWILSSRSLPDTRFAAGFGTAAYPYMIRTPEQLELLAGLGANQLRRLYVKLANDLDIPAGRAPLGRPEGDFIEASLDGGGHTVTYRLTGSSYGEPLGGLFYSWKGSCSNLTVAGTVDLAVTDQAVKKVENGSLRFGGFAGYFDGTIKNCTARLDLDIRYEGNAAAALHVGGLVGNASPADLTGCLASGSVRASTTQGESNVYAGGLVGSSACLPFGSIVVGTSLADCGADGTVSAEGGRQNAAGGLAGLMSYSGQQLPSGTQRGQVERCWSTAAVSASRASFQSDCGGIAGNLTSGQIYSSWAKPTISISNSAMSNIGGIAGSCYEGGILRDCWANASSLTQGNGLRTGGITGRLLGQVSNCYAIGTGALGNGNAIVFEGWNDGTVTACANMTGMTQAKKEAFYASCGWDFAAIWDKGGSLPLLRSCDPTAQQAAQKE